MRGWLRVLTHLAADGARTVWHDAKAMRRDLRDLRRAWKDGLL